MEWTVVVYDTDPLRTSVMCSELEQCETPYSIQIHAASNISKLNTMVLSKRVDVVFFDTRAQGESWSFVGAASDVVDAGSSTQVVLTGVTESSLVSVQKLPYAFLLPTNSSAEDIAYALNKSIALQVKELERPILLATRKFSRAIKPSHVSFIESDLRKIRIHLGSDVVETYGKLSEVLKKLPHRFVQCHKSFVVNLGFVSEFNQEHLVLTTGERVPVSQKKRKQTREEFVRYVGRTL